MFYYRALFLFLLMAGCTDTPAETAPPVQSVVATQAPVTETAAQAPLVNEKTLDERLTEAYDDLHNVNSALRVRENFPDLELVYIDEGDGNADYTDDIYPFRYYYSKETDRTFNLCNVNRSVFICEGKLARLITRDDLESGSCEVTPIYEMELLG
jgi:hypothetical protein